MKVRSKKVTSIYLFKKKPIDLLSVIYSDFEVFQISLKF